VQLGIVVPQAYDRFAPHFDAWQQAFGGPYDALVLPRVLATLARHRQPIRCVMDLGIGTGDLVIALTRAGYEVTGVDRSRPMLDEARRKIAAAALERDPTLVCQDIRTLRLDRRVDAAVCVYTVANQLTADGDLDRMLCAVHDALVPGGLFLCEVNLPEAYARYWSGEETIALPDAVVTREHRRIAGTPVLEALVTIRRSDGTTVHDRIVQRAYGEDELGAALDAAGFRVAAVERFNPFDPTAAAVKALWSTQRAPDRA
jgi:SAM-dependent methyltransferase